MSDITLNHIHYNQLNSMSWCASAEIIPPSEPTLWPHVTDTLKPYRPLSSCHPSSKLSTLSWQYYHYESSLPLTPARASDRHLQQRVGVRLLLDALLKKLGIADPLDDSAYPYRLVNSGYYICFSHSGHSKLSNALAEHTPYDKVAVALSYSRSIGIDIEVQDISWKLVQRYYHPTEVTILSSLDEKQRQVVSKLLWQIKECFIKINQDTLAAGLGVPYLELLDELIAIQATNPLPDISFMKSHSDYQIVLLSPQKMVAVL